MNNNLFFKPTPLYKEFMILDLVSGNQDITQRQIAHTIDVSLSMVNSYLDNYEEKGYLRREYQNAKNVVYHLTKAGVARRKLLSIQFLESTQNVYELAKTNITEFLNQIIKKGFNKILLYGAGEVAEIFLHVINTERDLPITAVAIIDDDVDKQGKYIANTLIISNQSISSFIHDGILISSYSNQEIIHNKLIALNYPEDKIMQFFEY